jgi:signal peptidase II
LSADQERRWRFAAFIGLAVLVIIVDQLSKLFIDANFQVASAHPATGGAAPTQVIGDFVRIAKSFNAGGIFGLFGNSAVILAVSSLVVIGLIVVYEWRDGTSSWLLTLALGLLLGGAVGNFIDRIRLGWVIDFVDMGIGDSRFYTFNVADSAISTALFLLIVFAIYRERRTRLAHQASCCRSTSH